MKKVIFIFIFIQTSYLSFGQFSIGFTGGLGEMCRDITNGYLSKSFKGDLELSLRYKFDSIPIEINITPYLISSSRYEIFPNYDNIVTDYIPQFVIMGGVGTSSGSERFVQVFASVQFGYWHTKTFNYLNYVDVNKNKDFEKNIDQFAIGPKFKLKLGKRRLKMVITYENYFLSAGQGSRFGRDRFTNLTVGVSYLFSKS